MGTEGLEKYPALNREIHIGREGNSYALNREIHTGGRREIAKR